MQTTDPDALEDQERHAIREIERANRAKALLDDDLIKSAFEDIERDIIEKWKGSKEQDSEGRERAFRLWFSLQAFRAQLVTHVQTGELAKPQLSFIQAQIERLRGRAA